MKLFQTPTTYRVGLIHAKLNRLLKQRTTKALSSAGINPPEWALLGVLQDAPKGMRLREVADELGVEPSFVTTMAKSLNKRGYVELVPDADDNRAKKICLAPAGKEFVKKNEKDLRDVMRPLTKDIGLKNLYTYFAVLEKLVDNAESLETA